MSLPAPRIIRFVSKEDNKTYYGAPLDQDGDIGLLYHAGSPIKAHVLTSSPLEPSSSVTKEVRTVKRLLSPLSGAEIKTIRGLGAQFGSHLKKPDVPVLFYKPITTISGPEEPIVLPSATHGMSNDYEVELCVVLGKDATDVSVKDALSYVLGYCTSNDVSSRALCAKGVQWGVGKGFDTWCPIGPVLVTPKYLGDPQNLDIQTTVNGALKQKVNTSEMILSVAELIAFMSQGTTLEKGSIILSGTPLPLERAPNDKEPWMKHGDEIRVTVARCGTLINHVVEKKEGQAKL